MRGLAMAKLLSKEQLVRFLYIVRTHYGHGKEKAVSSQLHLDASAFVQKLSYNVGDTVDLDWLTFVIEQERIRRSIEWRATTTQQSSAAVDVPVKHVRVFLSNFEDLASGGCSSPGAVGQGSADPEHRGELRRCASGPRSFVAKECRTRRQPSGGSKLPATVRLSSQRRLEVGAAQSSSSARIPRAQ